MNHGGGGGHLNTGGGGRGLEGWGVGKARKSSTLILAPTPPKILFKIKLIYSNEFINKAITWLV